MSPFYCILGKDPPVIFLFRNAKLLTVIQECCIFLHEPVSALTNKTSDIHSKEQALQLTQQNHTLTEALLLRKQDLQQPATNYHELKLDIGFFVHSYGSCLGKVWLV